VTGGMGREKVGRRERERRGRGREGREGGGGEGRNEKVEIIKEEQSVSCLPSKGRWTTCAFPVRTRMVVAL